MTASRHGAAAAALALTELVTSPRVRVPPERSTPTPSTRCVVGRSTVVVSDAGGEGVWCGSFPRSDGFIVGRTSCSLRGPEGASSERSAVDLPQMRVAAKVHKPDELLGSSDPREC